MTAVGFAVIFALLGTLLLIQVAPAIAGKLLIELGSKDGWWRPIRIKAPAGSMLVMTKASDKGAFSGIYSSVPGLEYDAEQDTFEGNPPVGGNIKKAEHDPADPEHVGEEENLEEKGYLDHLGLVWVGWNKAIFRREIRYNTVERNDQGEWVIDKKNRNDPFIFFQHVVGFNLSLRAKNNFPVGLRLMVVVELWHPVQALFRAGAWEKQLEAAVEEVCREFVGRRTVEQLREERDGRGFNDLIDLIMKLTRDQRSKPGLARSAGIHIVSGRYFDMDLETGDPEIAKAMLKVELTHQELLSAENEAKRIERLAQAQGSRYAEIGKHGGRAFDLAETEALSRAISEAKTQTVVLGDFKGKQPPVVIPVDTA